MIDGSLRYWLRAESGAELIFWTACYAHLGTGWLVFGICFLLPDLSMLGYLKNPRWGAGCYNAAHSYIAPALLGLLALGHSSFALSAALIWAAHIAFDRTLGYGMKETSGFNQTHLGPIGRRTPHHSFRLRLTTSTAAITILTYHRKMSVSVKLQSVHPRKLAAVRREVSPGAVGSAWGPALGMVWEFIRSQSGLWTEGHNVFLYHHPTQRDAPLLCDFSVEVTRAFETAGEVYATETPAGEAAIAVHRGPYNLMHQAHDAIGKWIAANRRESAGQSWEIYGDPTPDPADTETTVVYLLK